MVWPRKGTAVAYSSEGTTGSRTRLGRQNLYLIVQWVAFWVSRGSVDDVWSEFDNIASFRWSHRPGKVRIGVLELLS